MVLTIFYGLLTLRAATPQLYAEVDYMLDTIVVLRILTRNKFIVISKKRRVVPL